MGMMEDALKKAGLTEGEEPSEKPPAPEGSEAASTEASAEPAGDAPAESSTTTASEPASEPTPEGKEQPCAQCGTTFMAKHPRHRLCDKCAAERQAARGPGKPAS